MSSAFCRIFCKTRQTVRDLREVREYTTPHWPATTFYASLTALARRTACCYLCSAMNAPTSFIIVDITALSHDGRGIARLAPTEGQGRGAVVFVANALPGQQVLARVTRRKASFMEAECHELLRQAPDAAPPICPHHAECGGCPLQTMPYDQQLFWKRTIALDALSRIGGLDRAKLESMLGAVTGSPALTRFRNKMEFAFGPATTQGGEIKLGLRRRNGRDVVTVPNCALMPPEALHMVDMVGNLAAQSGLAAYTPPETRPEVQHDGAPGSRTESRARGAGRQRERDHRYAQARRAAHRSPMPDMETVDPGFWRFFVLRRGLAADLRTPRWWALCITSPGDAQRRAKVRELGREVLANFPQLSAFIHEERTTADTFAFGEKRVQTLDATGCENPAAARLFLPLGGTFFALDAASFFQVNTAAAQALARTAKKLLTAKTSTSPAGRGLLDLYCGAGAPGLLLAQDYTALLGLEQDSKAVKLAKINAASHGLHHFQYEAGDAALRLERIATCPPDGLWPSIACEGQHAAHDSQTDTPRSENEGLGSETLPTITDALVDPPRAGLSPRALNALLRIAPQHILYISCNPATLARDAAQICKHYSLEALEAVDLFPHTPHLECVSLWQKK